MSFGRLVELADLKLIQLEQRFFLILEGNEPPLLTASRWVSSDEVIFAVANLMF